MDWSGRKDLHLWKWASTLKCAWALGLVMVRQNRVPSSGSCSSFVFQGNGVLLAEPAGIHSVENCVILNDKRCYRSKVDIKAIGCSAVNSRCSSKRPLGSKDTGCESVHCV